MLKIFREEPEADEFDPEVNFSFRLLQKGMGSHQVDTSIGMPLPPMPEDVKGLQVDHLSQKQMGELFRYVTSLNCAQIQTLTHADLLRVLTRYSRRLKRPGEVG